MMGNKSENFTELHYTSNGVWDEDCTKNINILAPAWASDCISSNFLLELTMADQTIFIDSFSFLITIKLKIAKSW
jgi:hypothetical protein